MHLAQSPARQSELQREALARAQDTWTFALQALVGKDVSPTQSFPGEADRRFGAEAWSQFPFNVYARAFQNSTALMKEAVGGVGGVTEYHTQLLEFAVRMMLDASSPTNFLASNPELLALTESEKGQNLVRGLQHWLDDLERTVKGAAPAGTEDFEVGKALAVTPGKVVFRNELIELIQYEPATKDVHAEPLLIVPAWIMKYYILDLSPHNSMVRHLVGQGHTVYMVSWRNPDESDRELSMDDYLELGVLEAMRAAQHDAGGAPLHAMGYCLGGTLMAIAAAALSAKGGVEGYHDLPAPRTLSLLAAQVDFAEPGELGLFIDEGQINLLDHVTKGQGYLSGQQMAGSFQFLHSRELVWTRRMREYLMGEREQGNDLMAWNADTTRLPARMHHEYLVALYLKNALAHNHYLVAGRPVALADLRMPIFLVGTERDHVSPWRSVYKLHLLTATEISFVLASGGHNAGIVSEPGHPRRYYRVATRPERGEWVSADEWLQQAPRVEGSWWPAWQGWLAAHSSAPVKARPIPAGHVLGDAPGDYAMQRYAEP